MTDWDIIGEGNFLDCVQALKNGECKAIYGQYGGILSLNKNKCLVYNISGEDIYFSADAYLGVWRKLIKKEALVLVK